MAFYNNRTDNFYVINNRDYLLDDTVLTISLYGPNQTSYAQSSAEYHANAQAPSNTGLILFRHFLPSPEAIADAQAYQAQIDCFIE